MELGSPVRQGVRPKSPNAPAYSIQECLEDIRKIFRAEHQVPISRESIAEHLSLAAQSGPFNRKLSSLRQFGLLEPIGKDLRVSDLFLRIDHAAEDSDRSHALRDALGRPTIFQGLLGQYENSGIPSDLNLTNQLIIKYRFTKKNAETVARAFLKSYRFAGLGSGRPLFPPPLPFSPPLQPAQEPPSPPPALIVERESPHNYEQLEQMPQPVPQTIQQPAQQSQCRQEIPLGTRRRAVIELPDDVSPEELAKIIRVLKALVDVDTDV